MRSAARNACSVDCQEDREDKRLKRLTDIARDVGVEAAEDDATLGKAPGAGRALLDDHAAHVVWDGAGELPADDASVLLACGPGGGAQCVDGKVRVGGEELDEAAGVSGEEERVAGRKNGWRERGATYRWPTVPVAPRMPTLIWGGDIGGMGGGGEMNTVVEQME